MTNRLARVDTAVRKLQERIMRHYSSHYASVHNSLSVHTSIVLMSKTYYKHSILVDRVYGALQSLLAGVVTANPTQSMAIDSITAAPTPNSIMLTL